MSNIMSILNIGKILFPQILLMMLIQASVASIASLVFPAGIISKNITKKYFPNLSNLLDLLISSIIPAIYFTAILSITGLLKMKGYSNNFWQIYFLSLPTNIIFGYITSIFLNIILNKIIKRG